MAAIVAAVCVSSACARLRARASCSGLSSSCRSGTGTRAPRPKQLLTVARRSLQVLAGGGAAEQRVHGRLLQPAAPARSQRAGGVGVRGHHVWVRGCGLEGLRGRVSVWPCAPGTPAARARRRPRLRIACCVRAKAPACERASTPCPC